MSEDGHNQADHTELNSQVSHYFQQMKQYATEGSFVEGVDLDLSSLDNETDNNDVHHHVYQDEQGRSHSNDYSELVDVNVEINGPKELRPNLKHHVDNDKKRFNSMSNASKQLHKAAICSNNAAAMAMKIESRDLAVKQCPFCSKTFQHAGSLGRHLDNQKGTDLHPLEEINKLRSNVARRGDPEQVRHRRRLRAREYNRRDYVKEKSRLRRQLFSKFQKVRENSLMKFYRRINIPAVSVVSTFAFLVLAFLPPSLWPHDPPTAESYRTLISWIETNKEVREKMSFLNDSANANNEVKQKQIQDYEVNDQEQEAQKWMEKIRISFEDWQSRSQESKNEIWAREQRMIAQQLLGKLTYFDFAVRDNYAKHLMLQKKAETIKLEADKSEYEKLDDAELAAVAAAAAAAVKGYSDSNESNED